MSISVIYKVSTITLHNDITHGSTIFTLVVKKAELELFENFRQKEASGSKSKIFSLYFFPCPVRGDK